MLFYSKLYDVRNSPLIAYMCLCNKYKYQKKGKR